MRSLCGRCSSVIINFMSPHQQRDNSPSYANKSGPIRNNSKAMDVALMASADDRFENDLHLMTNRLEQLFAVVITAGLVLKFFAVHPMAER